MPGVFLAPERIRTVGPVEEIVVARFEGLGTFAVPVTDLDSYRVAAQTEVPDPGALDVGELGAVPLILGEDFLRETTARRADLVVDGYGRVRHTVQ